jgi:hypothetical protein
VDYLELDPKNPKSYALSFFADLLRNSSSTISTQEATLQIHGVLKDSSGNPIPYATLTLGTAQNTISKESITTSTTTDANGNYTLNMNLGTFSVRVTNSSGVELGTFQLNATSTTTKPEIASTSGNLNVVVNAVAPPSPIAPIVPATPSASPPTELSYSTGTLNLTVGTPMPPLTPSIKGFVSIYSISPNLPAGLSFNPISGVLSGTPVVSISSTKYNIKAGNSAGSVAFEIYLSVQSIVVAEVAPSIEVSNFPVSITEGSSISIGVRLAGSVKKTYTITVASSNPSLLSINPSTLTFSESNFNSTQQISVSALQDNNTVSEAITVSFLSTGMLEKRLNLNTIDDDTMNIVLSGASTVNEGSTASMSVYLTKEPVSDIKVNLLPSSSSISLNTNTIIFNSSNYSNPQNLIITGNEDVNHDSEDVSIIASSEGVSNQSIKIIAIDNDTTITFGSPVGKLSEGETIIIPVSLSGNPGIQRTVSFISNPLLTEVSPQTLTFSSSDYNIKKDINLISIYDSTTITASGSGLISKSISNITKKYSIGGSINGLVGNIEVTNKGGYDSINLSNKSISYSPSLFLPKRQDAT